MRKNFGKQTWIYPMPVLMIGTYDENGVPDVMNAAWGGVYDGGQIMLCLSHSHKTVKNIKLKEAFTVSFATAKTVVECDYLGIVSANDTPTSSRERVSIPSRANLSMPPLSASCP